MGKNTAITAEPIRDLKYYARTVQADKPEILPMSRPFSNFKFVEERFQGIPTLRRIMSQVRQHDGKTMVIEELKESEDLRQENEDIQIRYSGSSMIKAYRLSFYTKQFTTKKGLSNANQNEFLGYAITKEDYIPRLGNKTRVYESVIKPSRYANNFIRGEKEWFCSVASNLFKIKGYLYAQQNNITNVCAHVALRTVAARFHQYGDMTYREMNQLVGVDHTNRKVGGNDGGGLDTLEMIKILKEAGARCICVDYSNPETFADRAPFQKLIYGSIESGFPAIVIFQTSKQPNICHAIPVFGHTFNQDTWVYRAESSYFKVGEETLYIPSESWVSTYIAHDDNWGSNFCILRRYLHTRRYCDKNIGEQKACLMDLGCVLYVIGILPREVKMNALQAEVIGADYLFSILPQLPDLSETWRQRLYNYAQENQLILRPILIRGTDYSRHLQGILDWDRKPLGFELKIEEDSWLWMVELSIPELFPANKRKLAEVILRAEVEPKPKRDFKSFLLARVPGYLALYSGGVPDNPIYDFLPSGLKSHIELYGCEEID